MKDAPRCANNSIAPRIPPAQGVWLRNAVREMARAIERSIERATERSSDRAIDRATERSSDRATERPSVLAAEIQWYVVHDDSMNDDEARALSGDLIRQNSCGGSSPQAPPRVTSFVKKGVGASPLKPRRVTSFVKKVVGARSLMPLRVTSFVKKGVGARPLKPLRATSFVKKGVGARPFKLLRVTPHLAPPSSSHLPALSYSLSLLARCDSTTTRLVLAVCSFFMLLFGVSSSCSYCWRRSWLCHDTATESSGMWSTTTV